jgi:polyphosphate kinase
LLNSLIRAAETGKQVVCLVEVTARFDERQNLHWGRELEKVGAHVVFGVLGLKTHTKTTLVVRSESDGIRCYAHVGTGNYDVKTAKLYTDLSLLTCDPILTADVVELFHGLTGGSLHRTYHKLLVAPVNMRQRFLGLIEREIANSVAGRPARIVAKLNQLEDREMCEALVRASQAGVSIDLIIRGFCVLPPGVPGFTDHIRVISVIGRFLEHSRIYYFQNGQDDPHDGDYFIGSADWMERNLSRRVEAIAPIEAPPLRQRLWEILQTMLADRRQAWDMHSDGTYTQRIPPADAPNDRPETVGTQATLMATAFRAPVLPQPAS